MTTLVVLANCPDCLVLPCEYCGEERATLDLGEAVICGGCYAARQ